MSFSPLPTAFLTDLAAVGGRPVVELGCGDGRFTAELRRCGAAVLGMDLRRRHAGAASGSGPAIVADACRPPLRSGGTGLMVAANLVRHIAPRARRDALRVWSDCLASGGALWIFEDEPGAEPPAVRNYRDLQDWLARLVPGRGGLLPSEAFRAMLDGGPETAGWRFGRQGNDYRISEPQRALAMLEGDGRGDADSAAARLADRIRAEGLAYGDYWWARYAPGKAAA